MDPLRLLMRMAQWAHRPPSMRAVIIGAVVIVLALLLWAIESGGYWPEWAKVERVRRPAVTPTGTP